MRSVAASVRASRGPIISYDPPIGSTITWRSRLDDPGYHRLIAKVLRRSDYAVSATLLTIDHKADAHVERSVCRRGIQSTLVGKKRQHLRDPW
jgi:hypothetical protein